MIYVDTSAFVPLFIREPKSELIIDWLESSSERLAISDWRLVEFASATAIKVRTAKASVSVVKKATTRATEFARNHCTVAVPGRDEYRQAADLAGNDMLESARALALKTLTF
jgi:predicted nucleic acid-binding protein